MRLGKVILKDSAVYGFIKYLSVFSALLLTPVYTRIISKESYGIMELFNTWNTMLLAIIPLGMTTAVLKYYPDYKDKKEDLRTVLGTIFFGLLILSGFYLIFSFFVKDLFLNHFITVNSQTTNIVYWQCVVIVIWSLFDEFSSNIIRSEFRKRQFVITALVRFFILTILGFVFVYFYNSDYEGFYRASVIAVFCSTIVGFIFVKNNITFKFDLGLLKTILKFSIHFVSVFILFQLNTLLDRYLINEFIDLKSVGIFSIASRIATMSNIVFSSFSLAWYPLAMSLKNSEHLQLVFNTIHKVFVASCILMLLGVWLFRAELLLIFAPDYGDAIPLIFILLVANVLNSSTFIYSLGLHFANKTSYLSLGAIYSVIGHVVISISTVHFLGIYGIALGTLIGSLIWTTSLFYYSQQKFRIIYENWYFIFLFSVISILSILDVFWDQNVEITLIPFVIKTIVVLFMSYFIIKFVWKTFKQIPEIQHENN